MTKVSSADLASVVSKYNAVAVYLFGSQVDGGADAMSDVDIGVIFGDQEISLDDLLFLQDDLQRLFGPAPVDLVLLEKAAITVAYKAISQGELIYSKCDQSRTDFEERVIRSYQDFAPFLSMFYREVKEELMGSDQLDR